MPEMCRYPGHEHIWIKAKNKVTVPLYFSSAAFRTKAVLLLLSIHCLLLLSLFVEFCVWSLFCYGVFSDLSSFAINLLMMRELVA